MMTNQPVNRDEVERCPDCEHDDQSAGAHKGTTEAVYKVLTYGCNEQNPDCNSYCNCKNAFHFEAPRATLPAPVAKCVSCGHTIGVDAEGRCNQRLGYLGDVQPNLCPCWCEFPPTPVEDGRRCICGFHNNCPEGEHDDCECLCVNPEEDSAPVQEDGHLKEIENLIGTYDVGDRNSWLTASLIKHVRYLLDRLSQAEAAHRYWKECYDSRGKLLTERESQIAELTAQVESVRRETTIHARRAAEEISSFARRALNGDCPTKQSMEAIIINHFEAAATEGKSRV